MGTRIKKIETYLPEKVVTNEDLANDFQSWNAKKIEQKTGIKERHVVKKDETALDLAFRASEKVLSDYEKKKIDFLMLCTQSPEYYLPTGACILQNKLGLRDNIGAFDFNLGCSGFVYGLALAKGLITTKIARSVLLITSETYTKHINQKDKSNRTIFGDGAAAAIIEESDFDGILEFSLGTDGSGYQNLIVPNGGLRNKYDHLAPEIDDGSGSIRTNNNLYMNGPQIFNFTIKAVPRVVSEVLRKNSLTIKDIDYVIFHQANKYMLDYLRLKSKIPKEKFYINMLHTGNTVSATIPIALKDCINSHTIKKDNKVLIVGFGVGYSWAGTIIKI